LNLQEKYLYKTTLSNASILFLIVFSTCGADKAKAIACLFIYNDEVKRKKKKRKEKDRFLICQAKYKTDAITQLKKHQEK
jgi:hypothetical protein